MSWLVFYRNKRMIYLMAGKPEDREVHKVIGQWPAHNDVQSSSNGHWPSRPQPYRYVHFKSHPEEYNAYDPSHQSFKPEKGYSRHMVLQEMYGGQGIHIFDVPGRSGMGVHAGRSFRTNSITHQYYGELGGVTNGCIRVTPTAMHFINNTHNSGDKLVGIFVKG